MQPLSVYSCQNETVAFTCSDSQVTVIEWRVKPYTNTDGDLSYIPSQMANDPGPVTVNSTDMLFLSKLVRFQRINENFANMTTTLTVITAGVRNGTNVTCSSEVGSEVCEVNGTVYFASRSLTWSKCVLIMMKLL